MVEHASCTTPARAFAACRLSPESSIGPRHGRLWGPTGQINDYAKKEWAGLVSSYYKPRWAKMLAAAQAFLESGSGTWADASVDYCRDTWENVERPWQTDTSSFPQQPTGDTIAIARRLTGTYGA